MSVEPLKYPRGVRFAPTDEELVMFYLRPKVMRQSVPNLVEDMDIYKYEPWQLPLTRTSMVHETHEDRYFFTLRDRKYLNGARTNRVTAEGYWKATGRDREVMGQEVRPIAMKKTLVFYRGRAPYGERTDWVMHEYRMEGWVAPEYTTGEESFVVNRIYHKKRDRKCKKGPLGLPAGKSEEEGEEEEEEEEEEEDESDSPPVEMLKNNGGVQRPPCSFDLEELPEEALEERKEQIQMDSARNLFRPMPVNAKQEYLPLLVASGVKSEPFPNGIWDTSMHQGRGAAFWVQAPPRQPSTDTPKWLRQVIESREEHRGGRGNGAETLGNDAERPLMKEETKEEKDEEERTCAASVLVGLLGKRKPELLPSND